MNPAAGAAQRRLARALMGTAAVIAVLALVGLALPGRGERTVAGVAVGLVIAAPLLRVVWVTNWWVRERDWRFVAIGTALLLVVGSGALLALVT